MAKARKDQIKSAVKDEKVVDNRSREDGYSLLFDFIVNGRVQPKKDEFQGTCKKCGICEDRGIQFPALRVVLDVNGLCEDCRG